LKVLERRVDALGPMEEEMVDWVSGPTAGAIGIVLHIEIELND
jgi:hypothetical protein